MGHGRLNKRVVDEICRKFTDEGKLIEAGWSGFRFLTMDPNAPPDQVQEMRIAFFAGAQHLFGSIMGILEPGMEPTDNDLRRMNQIQRELDAFVEIFKRSHNSGDR